MRTFKKILAFVIAFVLSVVIMTLLFTPPSGIRILLEQAKNPEYDTLILGQSHGECGYNPYIISDELGVNAVNVSRRITPLNNFYYIIKEADKDKHYKTIILDVDPYYWRLDNTRDWGTDMNLFRHLSGVDRWKYFKEVIWPSNYNMLYCDYYVSLENIRLIPKSLRAKFSKEYLAKEDMAMVYVNDYLKASQAYDYKGRGFLYGKDRAPDLGWEVWQFEHDIFPTNVEAFEKIVNYCNENNIRLICTQSAITPTRLKQQNMDMVHDEFTVFFNSYNVEFYDFNYAKDLKRTDNDYVDADGHPMGYLADRQTKLLCDILKSDDKDSFFYTTYSDVLSNL